MKQSGKAFLRVTDLYNPGDTFGLPLPCDLTDMPEWKENGEQLNKYNLHLNTRDNNEVSRGIKSVSSTHVDTQQHGETVVKKQVTPNDNGGINVSTQKEEVDTKVLTMDEWKKNFNTNEEPDKNSNNNKSNNKVHKIEEETF